MNFDNCIVTADNEDVWTKVLVIWGGSKLQVLQTYEEGGADLVATFSNVDVYEVSGGLHTFRSSTTMTNQFGDEYNEVLVAPQSSGCVPCGRRR